MVVSLGEEGDKELRVCHSTLVGADFPIEVFGYPVACCVCPYQVLELARKILEGVEGLLRTTLCAIRRLKWLVLTSMINVLLKIWRS